MDQDDRDVEIERRLGAYADARLAPDPASMARVRAAVLDAIDARVADPTIIALQALPAPAVANRPSVRSRERGRLRGRDLVPVFRWDDPLDSMQELTQALPDALPEGLPDALAAASPAEQAHARADAPPGSPATAQADTLPLALAAASPEVLAHASAAAPARISSEVMADLPLDAIVDEPLRLNRPEPTARVRRAELIPVVEPPAPVQRGRWVRRGFAALLAAGLLLGGAVAVSAAPPDSPLYDTRLLLEDLTLPAAASERAEARVAALQERIKEARGAANGKNGKAVAAALKAYRAAMKDALEEAGDDPTALARLYEALGLHVEALEAIDAESGGDAQGAVDNALEDSQNAVTEIEQRGHGKPADTPGRGPKG